LHPEETERKERFRTEDEKGDLKLRKKALERNNAKAKCLPDVDPEMGANAEREERGRVGPSMDRYSLWKKGQRRRVRGERGKEEKCERLKFPAFEKRGPPAKGEGGAGKKKTSQRGGGEKRRARRYVGEIRERPFSYRHARG